ncbi:MAG: hypothetical protein V7749_15495 [Cocleimonas sp.]
MKKILIQATLMLCLGASAYALTDDFYASGDDLKFMFETNSDYALEEIENELRKFVLYRELEVLLFDLNDEYPGISQ